MPRQPDPHLEERILNAAQGLWKKGGDKSLTMRAVARAAGTNTPAVYRRFKDRRDLVRGLLLRTIARLRGRFESGENVEEMAEAYVDEAIRVPHEYELFYSYAHDLFPARASGRSRQIRDSRPNFAFLELQLAKRFGGSSEDHTRLALALWATVHGTSRLLLSKSIPQEHEPELRAACRAAVKTLLEGAGKFSEKSNRQAGHQAVPRSPSDDASAPGHPVR